MTDTPRECCSATHTHTHFQQAVKLSDVQLDEETERSARDASDVAVHTGGGGWLMPLYKKKKLHAATAPRERLASRRSPRSVCLNLTHIIKRCESMEV